MLMNNGNNMRLIVFIAVVAAVLTMVFATGCTVKHTDATDSIVDSLAYDTTENDTLETLAEETPMPKSADELFDDFIFNFAGSKRVQKQRIHFPLSIVEDGVVKNIGRNDWKFDPFFMHQGFYTQVVSDLDELETSKDTKVGHVVLEKVRFADADIRQYVFNRINGIWMMQSVENVPISEHPNGSFYLFCSQFVRDSTFRMNHMAESVEFSGPDPDDDFSRVEGVIMPEQVSMFAPELPQGDIYNLIYGETTLRGEDRTLVIRGIANGFEIVLTFCKMETGYMLVKLVV